MEEELTISLEDIRHAEQQVKEAELDVKQAEQIERARQEVRQAKQRAAQATLGVKQAKLRYQQLMLETKKLKLKAKQLQLSNKQARQHVEPSNLFAFLEECHKLSLAICFQTNMSKTYHGSIDPFGRLRPKRIIPWEAFPAFQQAIWKTIDDEDPEFFTQRAFASKDQLKLIRDGATRPIASESQLQFFQRETVNNHVQSILVELNENGRLCRRFNIHGYVRSEDEDNDNDQFYIHVKSDEQEIPLYAVQYQTPHVLSMAEISAGLHEMDLDDDFISSNGGSFDKHATWVVAAVITQLFSNMVNIGVQYGYIYTGEAFICLYITEDPSVVQYYLLAPNWDVTNDDGSRLHRTAVAQVLALTLNAMQASPPSQSWCDAANKLEGWEIDYPDFLEQIPESVRRESPSDYKPPSWPPIKEIPSILQHIESTKINTEHQYCTMKCLSGLAERGPLDPLCPNVKEHGHQLHSLNDNDLRDLLSRQLSHDRENGFEQLHIVGRTGYLLKATLLSHGYTVILKATSWQKLPRLQREIEAYHLLHSLQGEHVPVLIGDFIPQVQYWYHGQQMAQVLVLSWAGIRANKVIVKQKLTEPSFQEQRSKILKKIKECGVIHKDAEWHNIFWNEEIRRLMVTGFETPP
ncbi:hypothetical protein AbraIFM66950_003144 [Aspergillus brasiliensis]|nr:hypothetical protein AbraIFM66950_003144 [Aspergillus brasiliensis]